MSTVVYLHVGLHKTGTTYLQRYFRLNREGLRAQGVEYPGGPGLPSQRLAAYDLRGRRPHRHPDTRIPGQWRALADHIRDSPAPVALMSHESLALATLREARRAVASFPDVEVHVVVTARDLGRILVSLWQEEIKSDEIWTWHEYVDAVKDPARATKKPAFGFWRREDLLRICDTWTAAAGADRLHLVTVPPAGSDPAELVQRMATVVGFDPATLSGRPQGANEMVGVPGIEVLRQVNERLSGRLNEAERARVIRGALVGMLERPGTQPRAGLPQAEMEWVSQHADSLIDAIKSRGLHVVGDLDDLRPASQPGVRAPDDATDAELFAAAVDALAQLAELHATSWWSRRRRRVEDAPEKGDLASRLRGRGYAVKMRALELANRSRIASKLLGVVLDAETRRLERLRGRK